MSYHFNNMRVIPTSNRWKWRWYCGLYIKYPSLFFFSEIRYNGTHVMLPFPNQISILLCCQNISILFINLMFSWHDLRQLLSPLGVYCGYTKSLLKRTDKVVQGFVKLFRSTQLLSSSLFGNWETKFLWCFCPLHVGKMCCKQTLLNKTISPINVGITSVFSFARDIFNYVSSTIPLPIT